MSVVRIRRSGNKVVQGCDVYIGRACFMSGWKLPNSKWSNPFTVHDYGREESLRRYEEYVLNCSLLNDLHELKGKILGCWCKPEACHGDILLKLIKLHT
jgi:hypothetical protein